MTIAELDGYVAALIVCPEMVLPSEWLPGVWGGEHEFADVAEAEATIVAVMGHYNRIARETQCSRRFACLRIPGWMRHCISGNKVMYGNLMLPPPLLARSPRPASTHPVPRC